MSSVVVVTGTSTGVGKTVATAALAATATGSVVVVKPVQTGTADGDSDTAEVHRLTGCPVHTLVTLDEPLAPETAARRAGVVLPTVLEHAERICTFAESDDLVLVEGAGGLLVRLDTDGQTVLDLADELDSTLPPGSDLAVVVVVAAGLGTLNHTELTVNALRDAGLDVAGLVIGAWPVAPGLAERCNLEDLPRVTGLPLLAVIPAGVGGLSREEFCAAASDWFAPAIRDR